MAGLLNSVQRLRLGEVGELYPQKLNKVQMLIKITKDE